MLPPCGAEWSKCGVWRKLGNNLKVLADTDTRACGTPCTGIRLLLVRLISFLGMEAATPVLASENLSHLLASDFSFYVAVSNPGLP